MKLEEARRLKDEFIIGQSLPQKGIRGFRFTKTTVTVNVTSEWVAKQLPEYIGKRAVWYIVVGR